MAILDPSRKVPPTCETEGETHNLFPGQPSAILTLFSNDASLSLPELQGLSDVVTTATLELYNRIVRDLPPTPSKFHYIFNLRDLSRIYHGLSLSTPDRFDSTEKFIRLWRNECFRVFFDRLTNDKDRVLVSVSSLQPASPTHVRKTRHTLTVCFSSQNHVQELLQEHFPEQAEFALKQPLLYGDYRTALTPEQPRLYEDVQDFDAAKGLFDEVW